MKDIPEIEHEMRAAYMVMWVSRKNLHPCYSTHLLHGILRQHFDEVVTDLLKKGHIVPVLSGYYLTDEGVRFWAHMATACSTVNSFDPELKVWANWIMEVRDLLEGLEPDRWLHPERHVDYGVHRRASKRGWVTFQGDSARTRTYQITEAGIKHLHELHEFA